MQKRILGKTGLEVSLLGFGGFHLLEIPAAEASRLLHYYLDKGGNYIETAAGYGNGESEKKIGPVIEKRRDEVVLASKTASRDYQGALADIDRSLQNLRTDHLDIIFMHGVDNEKTLSRVLDSGGALAAAREAKKAGKVKHIGITSHNQAATLIKALKTDNFAVMMTLFNYYDRFNFPALENELLPLVRQKNIGAICMKPLADGFLYRSVEDAFRYVFSLPVQMVVTGMNSMEMLKTDLQLAEEFTPLTEEEKNKLYSEARELGDYVCRQCEVCSVSEQYGQELKEIFKLEGYFDRQMRDGKPRNPAEFALRDRLRFWLNNQDLARRLYEGLSVDATQLLEKCSDFADCKYGLSIKDKLGMIDYKFSSETELF